MFVETGRRNIGARTYAAELYMGPDENRPAGHHGHLDHDIAGDLKPLGLLLLYPV
jgi:hypothetical protein